MAQTYRGLSEITGIIGNMVLVNSIFHRQKDLFDIYLNFRHAPTKIFVIRFLRRKNFEKSLLKGASNYLLGPATYIPWDDPFSQSEA
jgi:hypothetical protein